MPLKIIMKFQMKNKKSVKVKFRIKDDNKTVLRQKFIE